MPRFALFALVSLLAATCSDASPAPLFARRHLRTRQSISHGPAPKGDRPVDYIPVFNDDPSIKLSANGTFLAAPSLPANPKLRNGKTRTVPVRSCFPGLTSTPSMPNTTATAASLKTWWCDQKDEYAFMGFSYSLAGCPSLSQLNSDFGTMRKTYNARYVRLYSQCDSRSTKSMYTDLVSAAAAQGLGLYSLVWFGFDGTDEYKGRLADLVSVIQTNPVAPYVIRNIAIGSEPLFDSALDVNSLAKLITTTKSQLSQYGIQLTLSDMPYGFQINNNAPQIFSAMDILSINSLPFFDSAATTGANAWSFVSWTIDYMRQYGGTTKPLRLTQTGWPSNDSVWKANSPNAVANVANEKAYFDLLDSRCADFKRMNSIGWFAHLWSDNDLPGWGITDYNGNPKFAFNPKTTC